MGQTSASRTSVPPEPLIARYRGLICDLDGVVYRGASAVPGSVETLNHLIADDTGVVFATNNASRPPDAVGEHLRELGLARRGWSVVTSSQAAAAYLADRLPTRTPVFAVGGPGVAQALAEVGLVPVGVRELAETHVTAVVQGLGVDVSWRELAEVAHLAEAGATWVATNLDLMLPTARGPVPGNGALVAAVQTATTVTPHVVGKPGAALLDLARRQLGTDCAQTVVCGDRLDTDIAGANAAGVDSLFVLSGASRLRDLVLAPPVARPTYVAADLTGLLEPAIRLEPVPDDLVEYAPDGVPHLHGDADRARLLRSVVTTAWAAADAGRVVCGDAQLWLRLEERLGLVPVQA
ncbi:HAD-IIA family hydrolase [Mycolicibacterium mageritense]|uniref:HAD-IIA family hydrolase n=1 Tax=Mycolicibacterium mageritense TaxID=53462 RepID=UPI000686FA2B|nr:HAD-IIA family hydrolase [Mycolicibacterium mageritense]MBN3457174.1 HAD-IIA family hydrolase [Mycobacterium sp. DSM 3803]MCC9180816.1 HAD-IIA family hydrolase [Mycolicibacterium mageritense]TXI53334.1 MAG: HAD-IIA family hydrolase [Mycolicibacterium mageritense]